MFEFKVSTFRIKSTSLQMLNDKCGVSSSFSWFAVAHHGKCCSVGFTPAVLSGCSFLCAHIRESPSIQAR